MMCEKLRQEFMEAVLSGPEAVSPEAQEHLRSCAACAAELASFQQTMGLLDEWRAPEPSPYFNTRMMARVREEAAAPKRGGLAWLRRPFAAVAAAVLIAVGVGLLEVNHQRDGSILATNDGAVSAVNDLQDLDKNADLFAEFDALDGQSPTE